MKTNKLLQWILGAAATSAATITVADDWSWNVTERPPLLENPVIVDVSHVKPEHTAGWRRHLRPDPPQNPILCHGLFYKVQLNDGVDGIVHMSGNDALRYPVHVTGGRNVRIVGLHFELVTQPGCDIGELPNLPVEEHPNANIHPRFPGALAIRVQQSGVTFLEGLHIDVQGHEADCIVSRNPDPMTDAQARNQRDVIVQNTYCSGVEGHGESDIGDGIHGDFFQNQGRDPLRRLIFENVSMRTSQEGIVLHGGTSGRGTQSLVVRRYDYTWDPRFVGDDAYDHKFGLAFVGWPSSNWTLEDVYIDDPRDNLDYLKINNQRYGVSTWSEVKPHEAIRSGLPDNGAFAPPDQTGVNYVTPHEPVPGF